MTADSRSDFNHDASPEYARLREHLVALKSEAEPDQREIDRVIDELEKLQLLIKGQHGIKGNNPNE